MGSTRRWVVRQSDRYKVEAEQQRGYEPTFNLYTRESFFGLFTWWSFEGWAVNLCAIDRYISRCDAFDAGDPPTIVCRIDDGKTTIDGKTL